jgi:hypothetical protein
MNNLLKRIKEILWKDWDPIGVNDLPEACNEYDTYASVIYVNYAQYSGFSENYIFDYLLDIDKHYMENPKPNLAKTRIVAQKIFRTCQKYPKVSIEKKEISNIKLELTDVS